MYKINIGEHTLEIETKDEAFLINGTQANAAILASSSKKIHLTVNNRPIEAELIQIDKESKSLSLMINNRKVEVKIKDNFDLLLHDLGLDNMATKKIQNIKAPMPGLVLKVIAEDGQIITKGENLLVLEAMKMENMLKASTDLTIKKILVKAGDKVEKGQILIEL